MNDTDKHFIGHRKRLREKFLANTNSLSDYEMVELMLFWSVPRRDVKPLAKSMLKRAGGNLGDLIYADQEKIMSMGEGAQSIYLTICLIREIIARVLQQNVMQKNILSSWGALLDYLRTTMGYINIEEFRILFLNKKNVLIADEKQSEGTIDQAPVYPREVVRQALMHQASAIILVHNHPSGSTDPSKADIELTRKITQACSAVNVTVHDHVIVGKDGVFSFKSNLLL